MEKTTKFTLEQLKEIVDVLDKFSDAHDEITVVQLEQIRLGLEKGLNVEVYAKPEFDCWKMEEIRRGLSEDLDVSIYARPEFKSYQMEEIRLGLE